MKNAHTLYLKLIGLGIVNVKDFYVITLYDYQISLQGGFKGFLVNKLKKKGFIFNLDGEHIISTNRTISGVNLRIVLT